MSREAEPEHAGGSVSPHAGTIRVAPGRRVGPEAPLRRVRWRWRWRRRDGAGSSDDGAGGGAGDDGSEEGSGGFGWRHLLLSRPPVRGQRRGGLFTPEEKSWQDGVCGWGNEDLGPPM